MSFHSTPNNFSLPDASAVSPVRNACPTIVKHVWTPHCSTKKKKPPSSGINEWTKTVFANAFDELARQLAIFLWHSFVKEKQAASYND